MKRFAGSSKTGGNGCVRKGSSVEGVGHTDIADVEDYELSVPKP